MQFLTRRIYVLGIMSVIFKILKIFIFVLCMQALRQSGCWGENSPPPPIILLHNENSLVIRRKGKSQNGCFKKTKLAKFSEKRTLLTPWYAHVRARIRG